MLKAVWEQFLMIAKDEAGSRVVDTWLRSLAITHWDALQTILRLEAPNKFVKDWVETHHMSLLQVNLSRLLNVNSLQIVLSTAAEPAPVAVITKTVTAGARIVPAVAIKTAKTLAVNKQQFGKQPAGTSLNAGYTFASFVVGANNTLAHAAALAMAKQPGTLYNPLFIYGNSGLGKTHLLHAVGNQIKQDQARHLVLYQPTDRFVSEFVSAIRFNKMLAFKEKYRAVDVLLIDDIQFIVNKDQTQEAFFHIFNTLYESGKQIVFSGDCYPRDMSGLTDRLRSRLEWGLVVDVYAPALETKVAILKKKAEQHHELLSDEIAYFVADRVTSNVRELEGSLVRVLAFANLTNQKLTLELAQKVLGDVPHRNLSDVTLERVSIVVGKLFNYDLGQLRSQGRNKNLSLARQIAMYIMKQTTNKSLREIGIYFNRRDHSTVAYGVEKITNDLKTDLALQKRVTQVIDSLR